MYIVQVVEGKRDTYSTSDRIHIYIYCLLQVIEYKYIYIHILTVLINTLYKINFSSHKIIYLRKRQYKRIYYGVCTK